MSTTSLPEDDDDSDDDGLDYPEGSGAGPEVKGHVNEKKPTIANRPSTKKPSSGDGSILPNPDYEPDGDTDSDETEETDG